MGLILLVLGWVWGIWLADALPDLPVLAWAIAALIPLVGWLFTLKIKGWRLMFAVVSAFSLGGLRMEAISRLGDLSDWNDRGGLTVHGQVVMPPDVREARTLLTIQVEGITVGGLEREISGRVLAHAPRDAAIRLGDTVSVTGLLVTPPIVDAFDYRDYLGRGGVGSLLTRVSEVRVVNEQPNTHPMAAVHDFRNTLAQTIINGLPQPLSGLLVGVLLGDDRWIAPETMDAFNRSGAGHVLVVSGFNMTLVASAVMVVLKHVRRLGITPKLFITWGLIIAYALLVGGEPSTLRAAWMAGLAAFGYATGNALYLPLSAAFSVLMQTVYEPQILWDKGFQLSLAATCGMAFMLAPLKNRWRGFFEPELPPNSLGQFLRAAVDLFLTTLCILIFTMPLLTNFSGQISWVTLPVNLLIVPAQAILLMFGATGIVLTLISAPVGLAVLWLCLPLIGWTQAVVSGAASIPGTTLSVYVPPWLVLVYWGTIGGIVLLNDSNWMGWHRLMKSRFYRTTLAASGMFALVSVILFGVASARPDSRLHIWFLDSGGKNAVLIRTPSGGTIMLDGGDGPVRLSSLIGERLPANTDHLDLLILSAPDEMETRAWGEVGRRYPASQVLTHGQPNLGVPWQNLLTTFTDSGADVQYVTAGYSVQTGDGVTIDILWPERSPLLGESLTTYPLVVRVVYRDLRILLPGNLDRDGQSALLASSSDLAADVLMLPLHASARSLDGTFLVTVNPSSVVMAAGLNSPPDTDVLAMLGGRTLYQTGRHGTIHLMSDGEGFSMETERE